MNVPLLQIHFFWGVICDSSGSRVPHAQCRTKTQSPSRATAERTPIQLIAWKDPIRPRQNVCSRAPSRQQRARSAMTLDTLTHPDNVQPSCGCSTPPALQHSGGRVATGDNGSPAHQREYHVLFRVPYAGAASAPA